MFAQVGIGLEEVSAAEEAAIGGERRGMDGLQHKVTVAVDDGTLALRVGSPQHEDEILPLFGERLDDGVRERLPAASLMTAGVSRIHGERRIQEQHTLIRPRREVAVTIEKRRLVLGFQFLVDVDKRRGYGDAGLDGEAESMRLIGTMIGILPENDDLHLVERRAVERLEDETSRRVDDTFGIGFADKLRQFHEIGTIKLFLENPPPRLVDFHIHDASSLAQFRLIRNWDFLLFTHF